MNKSKSLFETISFWTSHNQTGSSTFKCLDRCKQNFIPLYAMFVRGHTTNEDKSVVIVTIFYHCTAKLKHSKPIRETLMKLFPRILSWKIRHAMVALQFIKNSSTNLTTKKKLDVYVLISSLFLSNYGKSDSWKFSNGS